MSTTPDQLDGSVKNYHIFRLNFPSSFTDSSMSSSDAGILSGSKQSVVDLRAGAILRKQHGAKSTGNYLGCPAWALLTTVVLVKCGIMTAWLLREVYVFDISCALPLVGRTAEEIASEWRQKRSINTLNPGFHVETLRNAIATDPIATVVTHTNTQVMESTGDAPSILMKTIRNRYEPIISEPVLEITLEGNRKKEKEKDEEEDPPFPLPPTHLGRIVSRHSGEDLPTTTPLTVTKNGREHKKEKHNKGKKSKKKNGEKRKGKGRNDDKGNTITTKNPRHLISISVDSTTIRPHQSQFLSGAIDPKDPHFSNRGIIRGYPMSRATKKPKKQNKTKLRISEETRRMWEMNEENFTSYQPLQPTYTEVPPADGSILIAETKSPTQRPITLDSISIGGNTKSINIKPATSMDLATGEDPLMGGGNAFSSWKEQVEQSERNRLLYVQGHGRNRHTIYDEPKKIPPVTLSQMHFTPAPDKRATVVTRFAGPLPNSENVPVIYGPVKHGFDRSLDSVISTAQPQDVFGKENSESFETQLERFTNSALCIARTLLDLWCVLEVFTAPIQLIGICCPRRPLFVPHLVLDVLFLVIAFIYSATIVVFSLILYVFVGEMPRSTLFEWLVFALAIDAVLFAYTCVLVVCLRCSEIVIANPQPQRTYQHVDSQIYGDML